MQEEIGRDRQLVLERARVVVVAIFVDFFFWWERNGFVENAYPAAVFD